MGPSHDLAAILSRPQERVVANDYTVRFHKRFYQLLKPAYPGQRGSQVTIEIRLAGEMACRCTGRYLK